jgi:multiple sugar transport system substrate-binding protein
MRKLTLLIASGAVVALVAALGAAAGLSEPAAKRVTKKTVTLAGWGGNPRETAALNATIARFERFNKDIDVRFTAISGDYDAAMLARFSARRPPDVFYVDSLDVPDYLPALEPLNSYVRRSKFRTRPFYARLLGAFTVNGRIYGFPKDWSPLGVQANTAMLQRAGITRAPTNWTEFAAALQRLRDRNAVPDGAPACLSLDWARILAFVYQNGGAWLTATRRQSIIDQPAAEGAVSTYLNWIRSGLARTPQQLGVGWCGEALGKEKAAFIFEGNWVTDYMRETFPNVQWATHPMLRNRQRGNLSFTVSYSIGKFSRNKQAAWRLLRYLVGPNGMRVWTRNAGFLPSRSDVAPPAGRAVFIREAPAARPWQFIKGFDRVYDLAGRELERAFEGQQSVSAALRTIDQATEEAISRNR